MMEPRMTNPAMVLPAAMKSLIGFGNAAQGAGVPKDTLDLMHMRVSQINGCALCVGLHVDDLKKTGEWDERLLYVAVWREATCFTDAERAAIALAEAVTRIADHPETVNDEIWEQAAKHYSESELAALLVSIAATNAWNRLNVSTRQLAGSVKL